MSSQVMALLDPETPEPMKAYHSFIDKSNSQDKFVAQELNSRQSRRVYLLTYLQTDESIFSTRESFAAAVEKAFLTTGASLSHWDCCREMHSNEGIDYHLSASVSNLRRWKSVKDKLKSDHRVSDHRVSVHFSAKSLGYVAAYRYVCKSDKKVLYSAGHPDLQTVGTSQITKKCMQANKKKASSRKRATSSHTSTSAKTQNENKRKKLGYTDVAEYILNNSIKNLKGLQPIAIKCRNEGEKDLFSFFI